MKRIKKTPLPFIVVRVDDPELTSDLEQPGVQFKGEVTNEWVATPLSWVVPVVLFFFLLSYLLKRMGSGGGLMQIGKSKAKVYIEKKTGVTFADVEGIDEAEEELVEVVEFLKNPQKYQRLGGRIPKGVLLVGPPGTGKTLLARAVAGEAGVPFFSIYHEAGHAIIAELVPGADPVISKISIIPRGVAALGYTQQLP